MEHGVSRWVGVPRTRGCIENRREVNRGEDGLGGGT